jgi:fermentation-respiration switch protein FrsA (DUF1100 family)
VADSEAQRNTRFAFHRKPNPNPGALAMNTALKSVAVAAAIAAGALSSAHAAAFKVERVTFNSGGQTLVGHLYVPQGVSAARPGQAAVVTGAWMTIKEQMAGRYAAELAERGIVALAFDFRSWGESGGQPRSMESPKAKTEDIRAAVAFLGTRAEVSSIGGVGICASAAYMAEAAATTPAIRSVALVAPWLHDRAIVNAVYGGEQSVANLIKLGRDAEARYKATGQATLLPAASTTDKTAVMFNVPYYTERDRGLIPQWENRFNVASWEGWLTLDAMPTAPRLNAPLLMVHSEAAAIPQGARQFFAQVRAPKRELWLPGVNQLDFYDREQPVNTAADAVAAHFKALQVAATLAAPAPQATPAVGDAEASRVVSLVSSIPLAVDLARYELAEAAFAPSIVIDYTSLWGGEPATMTPQALMAAWRGIVPGFTATWHEIRNVSASVHGERATARADVDGRHWIGEQLWRPIGHYHWDLEKQAGQWKVTRMVFTMTEEIGSRGLAQQAMDRARALTVAQR